MKKIVLSSILATLIVGTAYAKESTINASDNTSNIKVYGVSQEISSKSYKGFGLEGDVDYKNTSTNLILEYGSEYKKASGVLKFNLNQYLYGKVGLGYLNREMLIESSYKNVIQKTIGSAVGYGDSKSYNIEVGYIISDLDGAARADGKSKISYIELVGQHKFAQYFTFDLVGSYQNTNVFDTNYADSKIELGYFPINDLRISSSHDSVDHDADDYSIKAGVKYTFGAKQPWTPFVKGSAYQNKNVTLGFEYNENIINKSLQKRDVFENSVSTSDIVANKVAPGVFASKTTKVEETTNQSPTWNSTTIASGANFTDVNNNSITIIDLSTVSSDPNGNPITYTLVSISGQNSGDQTAWNSSTSISGNNLIVQNLQTNDPNFSGQITFTVTATSTGGSATTNITAVFTDVQ